MASSPPERAAAPAGRRALVVALLCTAGVVLVLDQLAKAWAVRALGDGRTIDVLGDLVQLRLFRNSGAAFSFATGTTWIFTVIATLASIAIVRVSRHLGSSLWALALGLLLGGALGNLADRLFREPGFPQGHVVDFIDLPRLFVFNIADASITGAAALIALLSWRGVRVDGSRLAARAAEEAPDGLGTSGRGTALTGTPAPGTALPGTPVPGTPVPGTPVRDEPGGVTEEVSGEVGGRTPRETP